MTELKPNKQALIIAALVMLLCFVLLTGATLALFTNDAEDGTIGIITTSGDLEVDIVDAENTDRSMVGQVLQFRVGDVDADVLFEPGATFRTQGFKIKNSGVSIPINFKLSISNDENLDMMEFNKAFEVWISTEQNNPVAPTEISKFTGRLEAGDVSSDTYYLYIRMKENVGNDFQGKLYSGIGVTVYAVQGNVSLKEAENAG